MISGIDAIQPGWKVITADNENAGEIEELGGSDFIVRKGWLFPSDHRLPITTIAQVDPVDQQVYLSITKDQVEGLAAGTWTWQEPSSPMDDPGTWSTRGVTDMDAPTTSTGAVDQGYATTGSTADTGDTVRLQTHEERLQARPVERQTGEIEVRKGIVEDVQTIEVPVRREEVHIERRPVAGAETMAPSAGVDDIGADAETIRVPVMEEQVEVQKVVRPVEEVEISKRAVESTQRVSDTVRREEIRIDGDDELVDRR
jgi:uncharacterized protein (TIGR02271 family)